MTDAERVERLRKALALEVDRIVEDLEFRREVLLELWGKHRDRGMFLDTVHTRWTSLGFPDLLDLETHEVAMLDTFYRELQELSFYFRFTEDMPVTMSVTYDMGLTRLKAYGELALEALGGPPERPLIEFPEDEDSAADPAVAEGEADSPAPEAEPDESEESEGDADSPAPEAEPDEREESEGEELSGS